MKVFIKKRQISTMIINGWEKEIINKDTIFRELIKLIKK